MPRLVQFLSRDSNRKLQFEAAWALTNIASGASNQARSVVEHGAVPSFVRLLSCGVPEVVEQAIWALGNIAGNGPNFRDLVLGAGIVKGSLSENYFFFCIFKKYIDFKSRMDSHLDYP